jgi:hypothetical protein
VLILLSVGRDEDRGLTNRRPKPRFKIGHGSTAEYLNKLLKKAVGLIASSNWVHEQVAESLRSVVGDENSTIQSMNLDSMKFCLEGSAPVVDKLQLQTSVSGDFVEIAFSFSPELVVDVDVNVRIPVINNIVCVATRLCLHRLIGCLRFEMPEKKGYGVIQVMKTTKFECDVGARVTDSRCISTEYLGPLWATLTNWMHSYIYGAKIRINVDKVLNPPHDHHHGRRSLGKNPFRVRHHFEWSIDPFSHL